MFLRGSVFLNAPFSVNAILFPLCVETGLSDTSKGLERLSDARLGQFCTGGVLDARVYQHDIFSHVLRRWKLR